MTIIMVNKRCIPYPQFVINANPDQYGPTISMFAMAHEYRKYRYIIHIPKNLFKLFSFLKY